MPHQVIVYTLPDCPQCDRVKQALAARGYAIEVRDADLLGKGKIRDVEAMAELQMKDGAVPIVLVDGEVVQLKELFGERDVQEIGALP